MGLNKFLTEVPGEKFVALLLWSVLTAEANWWRLTYVAVLIKHLSYEEHFTFDTFENEQAG